MCAASLHVSLIERQIQVRVQVCELVSYFSTSGCWQLHSLTQEQNSMCTRSDGGRVTLTLSLVCLPECSSYASNLKNVLLVKEHISGIVEIWRTRTATIQTVCQTTYTATVFFFISSSVTLAIHQGQMFKNEWGLSRRERKSWWWGRAGDRAVPSHYQISSGLYWLSDGW